jgi:hypothetical protein
MTSASSSIFTPGATRLSSRLDLRALVLGALAAALELLLCLLQGSTTPLAGAQMLGQLIAACLPIELILGRVYL